MRCRVRGGEQLGPYPVDEQDTPREEPRIGGEEARRGGRPLDIAALVADAERRAVENRQRHVGYPAGPTASSVSLSNRSTRSSGTENVDCSPWRRRGSTGSFATISRSPRRRCASCSSPRYSTTSTSALYCAAFGLPFPRWTCSGLNPASCPGVPRPSTDESSRFIAGEPMNVATKVLTGFV